MLLQFFFMRLFPDTFSSVSFLQSVSRTGFQSAHLKLMGPQDSDQVKPEPTEPELLDLEQTVHVNTSVLMETII